MLTSQAADQPQPQADKPAKKASPVSQETTRLSSLARCLCRSLSRRTESSCSPATLPAKSLPSSWHMNIRRIAGKQTSAVRMLRSLTPRTTSRSMPRPRTACILDGTTGKELERVKVADSSPSAHWASFLTKRLLRESFAIKSCLATRAAFRRVVGRRETGRHPGHDRNQHGAQGWEAGR